MEDVRQYLMQITAAAIICGIVTAMVGKKGPLALSVRLIAVVFMTLTFIGPLVHLKIPTLPELAEGLTAEGDRWVAEGENSSWESVAAIIKERTEAYILDKADSFGAQLRVQVTVSGDDIPVPCAVELAGTVSPYGKSRLSQMIEEDLGIPGEEQTWIESN